MWGLGITSLFSRGEGVPGGERWIRTDGAQGTEGMRGERRGGKETGEKRMDGQKGRREGWRGGNRKGWVQEEGRMAHYQEEDEKKIGRKELTFPMSY